MERVRNFVICLNAIRQQDSQGGNSVININGLLSNIVVEKIPATFSFSVVFSILGMDITNDNKLRIIIKNDKKQTVVDTETLTIPKSEVGNSDIPKKYLGMDFTLDLRNVLFNNVGVHNIEIFLNSERIFKEDIFVSERMV